MHVHAEGRDEPEAQVVAKRPGIGVGAKVPAHQRAVDGGVRQNRLGAGVEMMDVDRTAVLLEVQRPERGQEQEAVPRSNIYKHTWSRQNAGASYSDDI